ncbi:MAG: D-aminoacylase [Candidatus Eremiobacteraeota bacterium]|nr:D-aminoacylase [Candidatus Eremiobacteraeota bacterium]
MQTSSKSATVIAGAAVLDGLGNPARHDDVFIVDGRIDDVRPHADNHAGFDVIDASGLTLTPGFIDSHSHADNAPFLAEDDTSKILQGVTTEVVGNCGFSLAPVNPQRRDEHLARVATWKHDFRGSTFAEFLADTDRRGYVTNYVPLAGHGTLRLAAMGSENRAPTLPELAHMGDLLEESLQAGAFGMSSGLIYPPGIFSKTDELVALAKRLPPGAVYASHIRGEGSTLLDAVGEALTIGEQSTRRVMISHHKAAGKSNWGATARSLERIHDARARGVDVFQDVYPYTASSTLLSALIPPDFHAGGHRAMLTRLNDPSQIAALRVRLSRQEPGFENMVLQAGYDNVLIASTASGDFEGQTLAEAARSLRMSEFDTLIHVLRIEDLTPTMVIFTMDESDVQRVMRDERTAIGSDGLAPGLGGKPHPRLFGTFPRIYARYVRELGVLTLPDAVRKMTSLPASIFGLDEIGVVARGKMADFVAFDASGIADDLDYRDPVRSPKGIAWVMQGGVIAARGTRSLGRHGRRLRPRVQSLR